MLPLSRAVHKISPRAELKRNYHLPPPFEQAGEEKLFLKKALNSLTEHKSLNWRKISIRKRLFREREKKIKQGKVNSSAGRRGSGKICRYHFPRPVPFPLRCLVETRSNCSAPRRGENNVFVLLICSDRIIFAGARKNVEWFLMG